MTKMDKEFLKEHKLLEAQKRFQQICEYTFITSPSLNEEGEEDQNAEMPQDPNMAQQEAPQGEDQMGGEQAQGMEQAQDPNMAQQGMEGMEDVPMEEEVPMDGDEMGMGMENGADMDMMQPGDEVIDVDDLTQSQQAAEIKIDDVDEKLTTLLNVVNKFSAAIEQNDQKIMDLKAEIERRNPTEEEKLNLRSQAAYPYNVQPKSYWDEKTKNSNYNVTYDNEIPTSEEDKDKYTFTKKDLKGINDVEVAKSFDDFNQLSDFINF